MGKLSRVQLEELKSLYLQGWSFKDLSAKFNTSKSNISFHINKWGINRYKPVELTENLQESIQKDFDNGKTIKSIAKEYHISKYRLSFIKKKNSEKLTNYELLKQKRYKVKEELVNYKGGKCCICGYNKYIGALEFHHLDSSTKDFGIAQNSSYKNMAALKKEVGKCVLVCANCHREIHAGLINLNI